MAFDHLSLPHRITGLYNSPYGSGKQAVIKKAGEETINNLKHRKEYADRLNQKTIEVSEFWSNEINSRKERGLPTIPELVPLFLKIDPEMFYPESLRSFGIEIISEEEDGFLIGASADLNLMGYVIVTRDFVL